ncbi:MAG: hypothetical protein QOJ11_2666 [Frankiales bacterium]|jgi:hypothetical protein|nr:hypothetical protein [Frankiales bacterium]
MDSNPLLNPVGSLPPEVYWRRRAMAGLLAVLVIWLAWSWFPGKSGGANAAQPKNPVKSTTSPHTTPSPTPTAVVTTAAPVVTTKATATVTSPAATTTTAPATPKCASSAIKITLTADHTLYPSGVSPRFVLTVANVSASACRIDVGTANRGFLVTSGNDRIWSSSDCSKTSPNVATFKPKDTVGYSHTWTRQRSSAAGCAAAGTAARPGTYKVVAHLGDLISATMVFRLA